MTDTIFTETPVDEEIALLTSLRAQSWRDFLGQEAIKESLMIAISAARQRHEPMDHVLLYGPPGLGKTTLAHLVAQALDVNLKITSGTALAKTGDLAAILTNLEAGDVLFIDEIHRLPKAVEETLYPAMEDYGLDIVIGKGPSARTLRLDLPHFTLIGATTRFGALASPFRDRFGLIHRLDHYKPSQLQQILTIAATKLNITLNDESALTIAERARGTPRIALQLLKRVRDVAQIKYEGKINRDRVIEALSSLAIDDLGLTEHDRRFLLTIIEKHNGGPVGLTTLAAALSEDSTTIEEVTEPYLLQLGFIQRTPKGRVVSERGYVHLKKTYPQKVAL